MIKTLAAACLLASPFFSSCVMANTMTNILQEIELNELEGRLLIVECRHLRDTERGQMLEQGDGQVVTIDLVQLGMRDRGTIATDVRAWLIPTDPEWTHFRALASSRGGFSMLHWRCASGLCRVAAVDGATGVATFTDVPEGAFDLFVHWTKTTGSRDVRLFRAGHSKVIVFGEGYGEVEHLTKIPKDRNGREDLSQQL